MKVFVIFVSAALMISVNTLPQGQNVASVTYSNPFHNSFALTTPNLQQSFAMKLVAPPGLSALFQNQAPVHSQYSQAQAVSGIDYAGLSQSGLLNSANFGVHPTNAAYANNHFPGSFTPNYHQQSHQQPQTIQVPQLLNREPSTAAQSYNSDLLAALQQQANLAFLHQQHLANQAQRQNTQQPFRVQPFLAQHGLQQPQQPFHAQAQNINADDQNQQTIAHGPFRSTASETSADQNEASSQRSSGDLLGVAYSPATAVSQIRFKSGKVSYEV